jgi:hypothetical protein
MKKLLISIITVNLLLVPALGADLSDKVFNDLKKYFLNMPIGKDFRAIEKELDLPKPNKTYMGSSSYHDRQFLYYNYKGVVLQIGLKQESGESSYEKGIFTYNGDFTIIYNGKEYSHCCSNDGWSSNYDRPIRQ